VGFRPFIWRTAQAEGLSGFVHNSGEGVTVELQGSSSQLAAFQLQLEQHLPPLAQIDSMQQTLLDPLPDEDGLKSAAAAAAPPRRACLPTAPPVRPAWPSCSTRPTAAIATPSSTVPIAARATPSPIAALRPGQHQHAALLLCPTCRSEYQSPHSRRFHAEPTACPDCGPQLQLTDRFGIALNGDPLHGAWQILQMGRSIAMKGLGGFHLV
jgi:hydrogenase maturation protein HypF